MTTSSSSVTFKISGILFVTLVLFGISLLQLNNFMYPICIISGNMTARCYTSQGKLILEVHTTVNISNSQIKLDAFINCEAVEVCEVSSCSKLCHTVTDCHTYRCEQYKSTTSIFSEMTRIEVFGWILISFGGYSFIIALCISLGVIYNYLTFSNSKKSNLELSNFIVSFV